MDALGLADRIDLGVLSRAHKGAGRTAHTARGTAHVVCMSSAMHHVANWCGRCVRLGAPSLRVASHRLVSCWLRLNW